MFKFVKTLDLVNKVKEHTTRTAVRVRDLELFVVRLQQEIEVLREDQEKPRVSGADVYVGSLMGVHLYANGNGLSSQIRVALGKFFRSIAAMGGE